MGVHRYLFQIGILLGSFAAFNGCNSDMSPGDCPNLPADQVGSFLAKAKAVPLKLVIDGKFLSGEYEQILRAANQWNQLGGQVRGGPFFETDYQPISDQVRTADPHDCAHSYGSADVLYVIHESNFTRWQSLGLGYANPGATMRCGNGDEILQQAIYLNDKLINSSQFMSVILHEMGHSLGLDHSCSDGAGSPSFKGCAGLAPSHPYKLAVMFPILDTAEIKEAPVQNDQTRTQCLFAGN